MYVYIYTYTYICNCANLLSMSLPFNYAYDMCTIDDEHFSVYIVA